MRHLLANAHEALSIRMDVPLRTHETYRDGRRQAYYGTYFPQSLGLVRKPRTWRPSDCVGRDVWTKDETRWYNNECAVALSRPATTQSFPLNIESTQNVAVERMF